MKVKKCDIGCRCTVEYDDIGRVDAMLVGKGNCQIREAWIVFVFATNNTDTVEQDQIIEIGAPIRPR